MQKPRKTKRRLTGRIRPQANITLLRLHYDLLNELSDSTGLPRSQVLDTMISYGKERAREQWKAQGLLPAN
jgi:hypothetical protein